LGKSKALLIFDIISSIDDPFGLAIPIPTLCVYADPNKNRNARQS
jgi:hypothetical protein